MVHQLREGAGLCAPVRWRPVPRRVQPAQEEVVARVVLVKDGAGRDHSKAGRRKLLSPRVLTSEDGVEIVVRVARSPLRPVQILGDEHPPARNACGLA
eukprot:5208474-Prymnesium_polylepis.1